MYNVDPYEDYDEYDSFEWGDELPEDDFCPKCGASNYEPGTVCQVCDYEPFIDG